MHVSKNKIILNVGVVLLIITAVLFILLLFDFDKNISTTLNDTSHPASKKLQQKINNQDYSVDNDALSMNFNSIESLNNISIDSIPNELFSDDLGDKNNPEEGDLDRFLALSDSIQAETGATVVFNSFTSHLPSILQMNEEQLDQYNSIVNDLNESVKNLMEYLYSDYDKTQSPDQNKDKLVWFSQEQENIDLQFKSRLSSVLYSEQFEKYLSLSNVERSLFGPSSLIKAK